MIPGKKDLRKPHRKGLHKDYITTTKMQTTYTFMKTRVPATLRAYQQEPKKLIKCALCKTSSNIKKCTHMLTIYMQNRFSYISLKN